MATIGTNTQQAYQPQSQLAPLDYRTLMESVKTIRDRYDRSQANLSALERIKSQIDVGGNESGEVLKNQLFDQVNADLEQYTGRNVDLIDAEHAINRRAYQLIGDDRMQALMESQQNRQLAKQQMMEMGEGNYYDFNPYENFNFFDPDGNVQRYTPDVAAIGDRAGVMSQLMANISKETIDNVGLTEKEVDAINYWYQTGTLDGITEDKIRKVAEAQLNAYKKNTPEGRVHNRILQAEGMPQEEIDKQMIEELYGIGYKQKGTMDNTTIQKGGNKPQKGRGYGPGLNFGIGNTSPAHGNLVNVIQNGTATWSQKDIEELGLDKINGPVYIGDITSTGGLKNATSQYEDLEDLRTFNTQLDVADGNFLSNIGITDNKEEQIEGVKLAKQTVQKFFDKHGPIKVGNATLDFNDFDFKNEHLNTKKGLSIALENLKRFKKTATNWAKEEYNLTEEQYENQQLLAKLDLSDADFKVASKDNNAQVIGNYSEGTNEVLTEGYARIAESQLADFKEKGGEIMKVPGVRKSASTPGDREETYYEIPVTIPALQIDNRSNNLREAAAYFKDDEKAQASWNTVQAALADKTYQNTLQTFVEQAFPYTMNEPSEEVNKKRQRAAQLAHKKLTEYEAAAFEAGQRFEWGYGDWAKMMQFFKDNPSLFKE